MFHRFQQALALRRYNKQRLNRISFLFQSGYYIFWQDQICKFTLANIKTIGFFKALFFTYHVPNRIPKKEELEHAVVKTGTFKHAVISESYCYLVFKQPKQYWAFRENYFKNIEFFNYPAIRPISCHDDLFYIVEPKVQGRSLTTEELPRLLAFLLKLFQEQQKVAKDEGGILYYVQHDDALPGNVLADQKDNLVFIDLDGITSRAALSDFFNVICRTQGFELLLKARQIFHKELELAFCAHQIQYTESVYDLYLSKFVEMRLVNAKNGHNDNILYKSMEWIFDPVAEKEFPLTHALVGQFNFELTAKGYRVY